MKNSNYHDSIMFTEKGMFYLFILKSINSNRFNGRTRTLPEDLSTFRIAMCFVEY